MRRKRPSFILDELTDQGDVDLTPLIDVVFVVLIMFILVAPMLDVDKIHLASGAHANRSEKIVSQDIHSLLIHVHEDNIVLINKNKVELEKLPFILKTLHKKDPKLIPQLYQDRKAYFGTYQMIKNAVEDAGYEELDIILQPAT